LNKDYFAGFVGSTAKKGRSTVSIESKCVLAVLILGVVVSFYILIDYSIRMF